MGAIGEVEVTVDGGLAEYCYPHDTVDHSELGDSSAVNKMCATLVCSAGCKVKMGGAVEISSSKCCEDPDVTGYARERSANFGKCSKFGVSTEHCVGGSYVFESLLAASMGEAADPAEDLKGGRSACPELKGEDFVIGELCMSDVVTYVVGYALSLFHTMSHEGDFEKH